MLYLLSTTCAHPCYSPHTPASSKSCSKDWWRHGGVPRTLTEVLGVHYTQSVVPMKNGVWRLVTVSRYSDVSVNIVMYTLFNNIVSDTIHSVVVCVDFLGTHMANLVLSLKLGVTCMSVCHCLTPRVWVCVSVSVSHTHQQKYSMTEHFVDVCPSPLIIFVYTSRNY